MTKSSNLLKYIRSAGIGFPVVKPFLILCVFLCIIVCHTAFAQVNVSAQLDNDKFHDPGKTSITVRVKNDNDSAINDIRLKADSISSTIAEELDAGETLVYEGEIMISKESLSKGFLTVSIMYSSDGIESLSQTMCYLTQLEDKVEATLYCVTPDRALATEETVPVRFVLANTGYTDIKNARLLIGDNFIQPEGFALAAQDSFIYETDIKVSEFERLQARVECESAISGQKYVFDLTRPVFELIREEVALIVAGSSEAKEGIDPRLTLNIENKGNVSYRMLEISANLAFVSAQLPEVLKPGDFISVSLTVTGKIESTASLQLTLQGIRDNGTECSFNAEPFTLTVVDKTESPVDEADEKNTVKTGDNAASVSIPDRLFYALINTPNLAEYVLGASAILSAAVIVALIRRAGKKKAKPNAERNTDV